VVKLAPQAMPELIRGLLALRGIAHISAVTMAAELESARKLMGYSSVRTGNYLLCKGRDQSTAGQSVPALCT